MNTGILTKVWDWGQIELPSFAKTSSWGCSGCAAAVPQFPPAGAGGAEPGVTPHPAGAEPDPSLDRPRAPPGSISIDLIRWRGINGAGALE